MINCIIIDDEPLVRERLSSLISEHNEFNIIRECNNGASAINAINETKPQVIFLDIKMPKGGGFDVLKTINKKDVDLIIFVTAYNDQAIKAFEFEAFDYLLKPLTKKRFNKTIARIIDYYKEDDKSRSEHLFIKKGGSLYRIKFDDIYYIKADDNAVQIYTQTSIFRKRISMNNLMLKIQQYGFLRVHRSYIINPSHIKELMRVYQGDYMITLTNEKLIPTSKSYRDNVEKLLRQKL